jgi:4-diphosphocytidyl-2-C-methyl-D-erythritol kinase
MEHVDVRAPAKINLRLEVIGRRRDGYHEILTWIYPVTLEDDLILERVSRPSITLTTSSPRLPIDQRNLAFQAAALFLRETGVPDGVHITITKRIPVAAGLGGGSSNAAAVLRAMNELWGMRLEQQHLMHLGAQLGSDVPFFVFGRPAVMGGRGEDLVRVLPPVKIWILLVNPGRPLSTRRVYEAGNWGLTRHSRNTTILQHPQDPETLRDFLRNDLETPAIDLMPVVAVIRQRLRDVGARGVLMSGSGPSVFGIFEQEEEARQARHELAMEKGWITHVAHTVV